MAWEERPVPFKHWVCESLTRTVPALSEALDCFFARRSEWVEYNNDVERKKWAHPRPREIGREVASLFFFLNSQEFVKELSVLTGVDRLQPDPMLHGAGIHVVEPGGWLSPHLDYALHPKLSGMERRVNLILFLNESDPGDGGAFCLMDDECKEVVAKVEPKSGRAVVWCPGDVEYHATEKVSEAASYRFAACCYYLAPARPGVVRKRALFVPNRGGM